MPHHEIVRRVIGLTAQQGRKQHRTLMTKLRVLTISWSQTHSGLENHMDPCLCAASYNTASVSQHHTPPLLDGDRHQGCNAQSAR